MGNRERVRVRFAPSPTGYLHVGGARTALFNWLLARHEAGTFVLRIEDTDRDRSSEAMTEAILEGMRWLGLDWDEGPYHQADGIQRHRADAQRLLEAGAAYRCFCSPGQLAARRGEAGGGEGGWRYDRECLLRVAPAESDRRAREGAPHTIRFRVPDGVTAWDDGVHGRIEFRNADIEDFIVLRTDGTPIYNMAVVSDDVFMGITDVVRGDDHISNTPKQILLYEALGRPLPRFAHVPLILGPDGSRLSKRHGATAIGEYRQQGLLPEAMVNFLALLGWSPGTDEEIFTRKELIDRFAITGINRKSAIFDPRKLAWLNGQHLSRKPAPELEALVTAALVDHGLLRTGPGGPDRDWLLDVIDLLKVRARGIDDIVAQAGPYFLDDVAYAPEAIAKYWKNPAETGASLSALRGRLANLSDWTEPELEQTLRGLADELGVGAARIIHPLRVALIGQTVSPGIFEVARVLGRERTLRRLDAALVHLETLSNA